MDPNLVLWWLSLSLMAVLGVVLWSLGFLLETRPDTRFRLLTGGALVTYVVSGVLLGFALATAMLFVALWGFAIAAGVGRAYTGT
jgi:hypothetical protein